MFYYLSELDKAYDSHKAAEAKKRDKKGNIGKGKKGKKK